MVMSSVSDSFSAMTIVEKLQPGLYSLPSLTYLSSDTFYNALSDFSGKNMSNRFFFPPCDIY